MKPNTCYHNNQSYDATFLNTYCATEYPKAVILIEQPTQVVQMSDKAYGTGYVPFRHEISSNPSADTIFGILNFRK